MTENPFESPQGEADDETSDADDLFARRLERERIAFTLGCLIVPLLFFAAIWLASLL